MPTKNSDNTVKVDQNLLWFSTLFHNTLDLIEESNFDAKNLTITQGKVLFSIFSQFSDGVMLKDLAQAIKVSLGFCSSTVDSLVKCGLLERIPKSTDRRAILIRPTALAWQLKNERDAAISKLYKKLLRGQDKHDIEIFESVVTSLYQNLKAINAAIQSPAKK